MEKTGVFEEKPGVKSHSRVMITMVVVSACLFTGMLISKDASAIEAGTFFTMVIGAAGAWKVTQKIQEGK